MTQFSGATGSTATGVDQPRKRVLVVEDDRNLQEALRYNLVAEGYEVTVAGDGGAALDQGRGRRPERPSTCPRRGGVWYSPAALMMNASPVRPIRVGRTIA